MYRVFHFNIWYLTCRPKFKHYALPKHILTLDLNAQKIKSCSINTACMIWSYVRCTPKKSLYLFATLRLCWFKYGNRYQIFIVVLNDHALVIYVIWNNNFFLNQFDHILIQNRLMIIRIMISKLWASLLILQKTIKDFLYVFLLLSKSFFSFCKYAFGQKTIFWYLYPWVLLIYRYLHIRRNVLLWNLTSDFCSGQAQN